MEAQLNRKKVLAWSLYDWANSAYATTVLAGFFPVFFKSYWSAGASVTTSTFQLGLAHSIESLLIALAAPILGAMADRSSAKNRFLLVSTLLGVVGTAALYFVAQGDWFNAILVFTLSGIGFSAANIFYDALLVNVATDEKAHFVSALGYALGYLGGGLLFAINVSMLLWPSAFGLAGKAEAVRTAFLTVAVWWALFSIPIFVFVREPRGVRAGADVVWASLREISHTFREIRRLRPVLLFLAAYWLYIDAVGTVIRMAVDYGMALGFDASQLLLALLLTQFVAFPAAIVFGKIGERFGAKAGIFIGIAVYIGASLWAMRMSASWEFYGLAISIGSVQGGVQSLSRSFYARLIPQNKSGEFVGFYHMLGKFAAILGPILMGAVSIGTGDPRLSILALVALFVGGAVLLHFVQEAPTTRILQPE